MKSLMALFGSLVLSTVAFASPFEGVSEDSPKCFESAYSEAHLAGRPRQTVKAMRLTLLSFKISSEKQAYYYLDVTAKLKGEKYKNVVFNTSMSCETNGRCTIDCDGGNGSISERNGRLIFRNNGIVLQGTCGEIEGEILHFLKSTKGGDDIFSLAPAKSCKTPKWFKEFVKEAKAFH